LRPSWYQFFKQPWRFPRKRRLVEEELLLCSAAGSLAISDVAVTILEKENGRPESQSNIERQL